MPSDYQSQRDAAVKLIANKGAPVRVRRFTGPTTYDEYQTYSVAEQYRVDQLNVATINNGDEKFLFAADALPITPVEGDLVLRTVNGVSETWAVVRNQVLAPGGVPVLYTAQVRPWPRT